MIFVLGYQCIDKGKRPQTQPLLVIWMTIIGMVLFFFDELSMQEMIGNILAIVFEAFFGIQFYLSTKEKAVPMSSTVIAFAISSCLILFLIPQLVEVKIMEGVLW